MLRVSICDLQLGGRCLVKNIIVQTLIDENFRVRRKGRTSLFTLSLSVQRTSRASHLKLAVKQGKSFADYDQVFFNDTRSPSRRIAGEFKTVSRAAHRLSPRPLRMYN